MGTAKSLAVECPNHESLVRDSMSGVETNLAALKNTSAARRTRLDSAIELQQFLRDQRNTLDTVQDTQTLVSSEELAEDLSSAEAMLEKHSEHKSTMDAVSVSVKDVVAQGQALIAAEHFARDRIDEGIEELVDGEKQMQQLWQDRQRVLEQCRELHTFQRDGLALENWMGSAETFLSNADVGESYAGVELLMKKYDEFVKTMPVHEGKLQGVEEHGARLVSCEGGHYASEQITERQSALRGQWRALEQLSESRRQRLVDSMQLQAFFRDATEADVWVAEKMKTATDESFRDPTNLVVKVKQHEAFEAEVSANKSRIDNVSKGGQALVDVEHYATEEVQQRMSQVEANYAELVEASKVKAQVLHEATEAQQFYRDVADVL